MRILTLVPLALALIAVAPSCADTEPSTRSVEFYCQKPPAGSTDQEADHKYIACERDRVFYDEWLEGLGGTSLE